MSNNRKHNEECESLESLNLLAEFGNLQTDTIQIHEGFKSNKNNVNVILTSDNSTGIITFLSCEEVITVPSATTITKWHTHPLPGLKMPALEITLAWANFLLHHAHFCSEQTSSHMRV
jgi:hypothetical protein